MLGEETIGAGVLDAHRNRRCTAAGMAVRRARFTAAWRRMGARLLGKKERGRGDLKGRGQRAVAGTGEWRWWKTWASASWRAPRWEVGEEGADVRGPPGSERRRPARACAAAGPARPVCFFYSYFVLF